MNSKFWERNPYSTRPGIECINSCLYNFLVNDNQKISKSDIYFAGNGFSISYSKNRHLISSRQYQGNLAFLEEFMPDSCLDYVVETYEGEMKEFLYEKLSAHSRIALRVSSSNLPYNKAFDPKKVVIHYIDVIGMNQETSQIKISDGCAPVVGGGCFEDWVDTDAIIENWQNMNGAYIELQYDTLDCKVIHERAHANMKKGIKRYLRKGSGFFKSDIAGYQGILHLFQDVAEHMESENALGIVRELNQQLRIDGYLSSKFFILEKMREMNWSPEDASQYEALILDYDMICLNAMKSVIKKQPEAMGQVMERVRKSVELEQEILNKFMKVL